jgi:HAE1 family hydrophobic/amphiphilic exporter-1
MRIWLDPSKLKAVGLSAPDVLRSVRNENAQLPGGRLETEARQREFGVRTLAEARTAEEFKQMMLAHRGKAGAVPGLTILPGSRIP